MAPSSPTIPTIVDSRRETILRLISRYQNLASGGRMPHWHALLYVEPLRRSLVPDSVGIAPSNLAAQTDLNELLDIFFDHEFDGMPAEEAQRHLDALVRHHVQKWNASILGLFAEKPTSPA